MRTPWVNRLCLYLNRSTVGSVAVLSALAFVLALSAPAAQAGKVPLGTFGTSGSGDGEFTATGGVAVNDATGDVYVVDSGGNRVQRFDADGNYLSQFGMTGSDAGQFNFAFAGSQIAVDQSDGSVYVVDTGNNRVQKFTAAGAYDSQFGAAGSGDGELASPEGIAVDPTDGSVYVADTGNNRVQKFTAAGAYDSQFGAAGSGDGEFSGPARVAVDPSGAVYVMERFARVQKFDSSGGFVEVFGAEELTALPHELAVDPTSGNLNVAEFAPDFSHAVITEVDPSGDVVDVHGSASDMQSLSGLTVAAAGRVYVPALNSSFELRIYLLDLVPPVVATPAATDVFTSGATVAGSVNPRGNQTTYRFEYSADGNTWAPTPDQAAGDGLEDLEVTASLTGLQAGTEYRVRLVADNVAGSSTSPETTFTTPSPTAARAHTLPVGPAGETTATLGGRVHPNATPTTYHFEYGPTTAYGTSLPSADAGHGDAFQRFTEVVTGLEPGAAYHYRIVAHNEAGTTLGEDRVFTTADGFPSAPDGRRYEKVSPADKNGADVESTSGGNDATNFGLGRAAESGDAVAYRSKASFDGAGATIDSQYLASRGSDGWSTEGINPPLDPISSVPVIHKYQWLSSDLTQAVVGTFAQLTPEATAPFNLYLRDNAVAGGSYRLVSPPGGFLPPENPTFAGNAINNIFVGASADLRHIVVEDRRQLTSDAPPSNGVSAGLYEWVDGDLRLAGVLPDGTPASNARLGARGYPPVGATAGDYAGDHAISDDGSRIFFGAGDSSGSPRLYMREDGALTTEVSASERTDCADDPDDCTGAPSPDPDGSAAPRFQLASSDGSQAFFVSREKLTDDATASVLSSGSADLYVWNADAVPGARLSDLTTGDPGGGGVLGVVGASDDASRVYFVATGDLASGAERGEPNLYLWRSGSGLRHIAVLDGSAEGSHGAADEGIWDFARGNNGSQLQDYKAARITSDGETLLFASRARLTSYETDGHRQVYLYRATSDRLQCVSCNPTAASSTGDAVLQTPTMRGDDHSLPTLFLPRNLSSDGDRVFFDSAEALTPQDANGRVDVYGWENGEVRLISSGQGPDDSRFVDASLDGVDVFFTTREQLVRSDRDSLVDLYDARVDGGFPEPPPPSQPCSGDECQGPNSGRPEHTVPGSSTLKGAGDASGPPRASLRLARLTGAQRAALARGRKVALTIGVNRAGRVIVSATARLGSRSRTIARATRRVGKPGRVRLTLRLSPRARRHLAARRRLAVSLSVRFAGVSRDRSMVLRLRAVSGRTSR